MQKTMLLLAITFLLIPSMVRAEIKFFDDFESGNMLSMSVEGFVWSQITDGDSNKCTYKHCPTQGVSHAGSYSLMMGYFAGEDWVERRYNLNSYYPDIWVSYWIRVPTNYTHNSGSPANNKFGCLYGATYADPNNSMCWEMWPDGSGGSELTSNIASVGHGTEYTPFISVPSDRGRWMKMVFNVKASTTSSSANGHIKTWRRWDGDSSYTQLHNRVNINIGYLNGWGNGYLMGYANVPYTQRTDWYIDDFTISTTSLLDALDTTPPTSPTTLAANATSQSSISVSWTAATDNVAVTGYQVERCTGLSCSNFANVGNPAASPFVNTGLAMGTGYSYHVRAVDAAGNVSPWSNVVGATTQSTTLVPCNTVTTANFSQSVYNSYGAPFDAFQTSTNLMNAACSSADTHTIQATLGQTGDTTRIVYTKGYYYAGSTWTQYSGTCTGAQNGDWCQGSVSATITNPNLSTASASAPAYFVGMTCSVQGGSWRCGCRDTACSNFYWMIQGAGQ